MATTIQQYALYNEIVATGDTYTQADYVGQTNATAPLQGNNQQCLFIKGASAGVSVKLEVAYHPTSANQLVPPVDADFIAYGTYTTDTVLAIPSINGLWYRFHIINSGAASPITCFLGN